MRLQRTQRIKLPRIASLPLPLVLCSFSSFLCSVRGFFLLLFRGGKKPKKRKKIKRKMQMCLTHKQTSEYIYFTQPIQKVFVLMCKQMSKPPPPPAFPAAAHKVQGYRRSVSASKTTTTTTSCEPSEPKPSQGNPAPGQESVEFSCRQALQCITHTFAHTHSLSHSHSFLFYLSLCQSVKTIQEWVCQ